MFDRKAKPSPKRQRQLDRYAQLVRQVSPKSQLAVIALATGFLPMNHSDASTFASMCVVFITAVLTGVGVFDRIGQYAGAGAFVPISGFANAMVSPAMEFRREGLVLGLGAKLFTIAGPVLVWGISTACLLGIIYAVVP